MRNEEMQPPCLSNRAVHLITKVTQSTLLSNRHPHGFLDELFVHKVLVEESCGHLDECCRSTLGLWEKLPRRLACTLENLNPVKKSDTSKRESKRVCLVPVRHLGPIEKKGHWIVLNLDTGVPDSACSGGDEIKQRDAKEGFDCLTYQTNVEQGICFFHGTFNLFSLSQPYQKENLSRK